MWHEWNAATGEARTTQNRETITIGVGAKGAAIEVRVYRNKVRISLLVRSTVRRDELVDHYLHNTTIRSAYGPDLVADIQAGRQSAMLRDELSVDISEQTERARAIDWLIERRDRLLAATARSGRHRSFPPGPDLPRTQTRTEPLLQRVRPRGRLERPKVRSPPCRAQDSPPEACSNPCRL